MIIAVDDHLCPNCGIEQEGEIDINIDDVKINETLATAWKLTDEEIESALWDWKSPHRHFVYTSAYWFCDYCDGMVKLPRAYWNPETHQFDLKQPRPLTPREQAERDRQQQEAAGQLRLL